MVDLKITALLVVTLINGVVAGYVLFRKKRHPATVPFVFLTGGISLWALTNALFQLTTDPQIGFTTALISYYAGILIAIPFYGFASNFPHPLSDRKRKHLRQMLWAYSIVWGFIITLPGLTLDGVVYDPVGRIITGPGLYFHFFSIALFIVGGFLRLMIKYHQSSRLEQRQISLILVGAIVPALAGVSFNLILPVLGYYGLVWLGPNFSLVLIAFMGYAIVRHSLFNIRVLAVELFTGLLGLIILVQWLQSTDLQSYVINGIILLVYALIGWLLLSSVYREIRAKESLQYLLEQKTDFINMASHQLRTPLTAIRGLLEMLVAGDYDNDPPQKRKQVLKNVLISAQRLSNVVNDMLEAAELEKGVSTEIEKGDIALLVKQSIETLKSSYQQKDIKIKYSTPKEKLPLVRMRTRYLQQAFLNLIDNAQRYTPEGGNVQIHLSCDENRIQFKIQDSGIGIATDDIPKLFHKFYRTENAQLTQPTGTGLGLYIVKQIIEEHGGNISVSSKGVNKGTNFSVTLPIEAT